MREEPDDIRNMYRVLNVYPMKVFTHCKTAFPGFHIEVVRVGDKTETMERLRFIFDSEAQFGVMIDRLTDRAWWADSGEGSNFGNQERGGR